MDSQIYLSGCASELGNRVDIAETTIAPSKIEELKSKGLQRYSDCTGETVTGLAKASIEKTLSSSGLAPEDIDAVVLCTSSYWFYEELRAEPLGRMLCEAGLEKANIIVSSVMGCHNAITAIRIAENLIKAEGMNNIIAVTSDLAEPGDSRLSEDQTVVGDGAASCLISSTRQRGYKLVDLVHNDMNGLYKYGGSDSEADFMARATIWLQGIKDTSREVLERNNIEVSDIKVFLINNYNTVISDYISDSAGIEKSRTIPFDRENGHVWSSDIIIGLESTPEFKHIEEGDRILLLGSGKQNFGAVLLETVN